MTISLGVGNDQVLVKGKVMNNLTINGRLGNDRIDIGDYVPLTTPNPTNSINFQQVDIEETLFGPL